MNVCALPASLILSTVSCGRSAPSIELLHTAELDFPSASAVEFLNNRLYVFGDDAPALLVLSPGYKIIDTVRYWPTAVKRIGKSEKPDIESAFVTVENGVTVVVGLGSLSGENRWTGYKFSPSLNRIASAHYFPHATAFNKLPSLNIEGSCVVGKALLLSNRANLSHPQNQLLFYDSAKPLEVKSLLLPKTKTVAGVSGLFYVREMDLLLFTASEEETANAIDDGAIGDSYLGGIKDFAAKQNDVEVKPDFFLSLQDFEEAFAKQKIESVCLEKIEGADLVLHLAADNDNGRSRLFRVTLHLNP